MLRAVRIRIAFFVTAALLYACPQALSQNVAPAPAAQMSDEELVRLKFSPGRWFYEVRGDVSSIETTEYMLERKNGRMVETRRGGKKILYFDRRGFETESTDDDNEGRTLIKYDAQGRLAEMAMWLGGMPLSRDLYSYDVARRRVTVESYYFGEEKPLLREVSIFDERWNEIRKETERFDDNRGSKPGKEVVVYHLAYDSKGRVIATSITDERGALSYRFTTEFDDSNRLVRGVSFQYDAASGTLLTRSVNTYDKGGLLNNYSHYDGRGRLLRQETIERELDARGNWITERRTMQSYEGSEPGSYTLIKRRRINYY